MKLTKAKIRSLYIADTTLLKFRWQGIAVITTTGSTEQIFVANNLDSPAVTSSAWIAAAGGNTHYATIIQWGGFYQNFTVLANKIHVDMSNEENASIIANVYPTTDAVPVVAVPITHTAANNDVLPYLQMPYARHKMLGVAGGQQRGQIKNYMTTNKIFGINKSKVVNENDYSASIANGVIAVPNKQWYWALAFFDSAGAVTNRKITVAVTMTAYVRLWGRKTNPLVG